FGARRTGSPPWTRCRAIVPPMLPVPMIAVAMATPPFCLTPQLTSRTHPTFPPLRSLTDSNRRPPPYHALRNGCRGLPPVADRLVLAVFGVSHLPRVATGCARWALSEEGPRVKSSCG